MTHKGPPETGLAPERRTIDVVPDGERHGSPRSQFTLWFGANTQITAMVGRARAVAVGADALWAILGLLIGNVFGCAVMALHSAQGPRVAQKLYTGPVTEMLGGADISWMVGMVFTAAVYHPPTRRTSNPPTRMIYPQAAATVDTRA